jgi:crotonyl-CoA carboxylase/reductase
MSDQDLKDLYDVGEIPPVGHVPAKMHAWAIRREREGAPDKAMQLEVVDIPTLADDEVLIFDIDTSALKNIKRCY